MPRRASIRTLLVHLVLAVALPLAVLTAWVLFETYRDDQRQARTQVLQLAQMTASQTAIFLGQAHNILNGLAARPAVRALDASRCDPILKDFLGLAPRFSNIVTSTLDGRVICSAAPLVGPTRLDPDNLLNRLRGPEQLTVGRITRGTITGRWAALLGRPLLDAQGGVAGAVGLAVDLLTLPVLPSVEGLAANTVVALIAGDGTVLARSSEAQRFVGSNQGNTAIARTVLRDKRGTAEDVGIDGVARILGFAPIPGTDWIAVASVPARGARAALGEAARGASAAARQQRHRGRRSDARRRSRG